MALTVEIFLIYVAATVLGICCLFAYNSFLASPYYLEHYFQFAAVKYTDNVSTLPEANTPSFWKNISTWVTVLMMVPMFLLQFLMLSPFILRQKVQARMIIGAALSLVAVLIVPVCAASGGVSEGGAIAVLIIACILAGAATTTLESALYALFGSLPTRFMTGFVMGGGFSGSINSVLRIIIAVSLPPTFSGVKTSAVIFFSIGMALMVVTILIAVLLRYSKLVRTHCKDYRRPGELVAVEGDLDKETGTSTNVDAARTPIDVHPDETAMALEKGGSSEPCIAGEAEQEEAEEEEGEPSVFRVIRKIWLMMVCLAFNMFTTLLLFPGIGLKAMYSDTSASETSDSSNDATWASEATMPMIVILMYNVGDTVGRLSINFRFLWCPERFVWIGVLARAIACTIPLALGICTPKIINSNANPIVVFLILGITNGYFIGLTMAYGSSDKSLTKRERNITGACLCFALLCGTTSGSVISLLILTFAY